MPCGVPPAGPAGSTAAMYLARQGFQVDVFERRPEPKADSVSLHSLLSFLVPLQTALTRTLLQMYHLVFTRVFNAKGLPNIAGQAYEIVLLSLLLCR